MELKGHIKAISKDLSSSKYNLTIETEKVHMGEYEALKDKEISVTIKQYRKKRSLDCNAYAWVLLDKLSKVMKLPVTEIYKMEIMEIGVSEIIPIKDDKINKFIEAWNKNGLGWICESLGKSKLDGYTNLKVYYGSSTYDSKEMSLLINSIVEDCKLQEIETATPQELERMCQEWK